MGRHADPEPRHFWLSLGAATLRAGAALAVVIGLFAVLANLGRVAEDGPVMLGDPDDGEQSRSASSQPSPEPEPTPRAAASPDPAPDQPPPEPAGPQAEADPESPEAIIAAAPPPQETTVQVLDGIGGSPRLPLLVAALEDLGYEVVATNPAGTDYAVTTVLFTEGNEHMARALQARDPRIVERRPNTEMSAEVDLHVVLGADWEP
ncbi:MAG TPA: LytR C-terminal domain-containing protein [Egibacteraceae bacterium]|nr:LytR C-terminal domain-containing protein [Egibacteraceae bacterium]